MHWTLEILIPWLIGCLLLIGIYRLLRL